MDNQKLSEKIDYTKELFGESILPEIPEAILNNLKHNMWPLQEEAFRNFLFYENLKERSSAGQTTSCSKRRVDRFFFPLSSCLRTLFELACAWAVD